MKTKIIHFIWVDKYDISNDNIILPKQYKENIDSFRKIYQGWEIKLWKGSELINLISLVNNQLIKEVFYSYTHFIAKLDFIRYLILFYYGGVYLDCDTICKKFFDFTQEKSLVLVKLPEDKERYPNYDYIICNGIIYSDKLNPILNDIIIHLINRCNYVDQNNILKLCGPVAITEIYQELDQNNIELLSSDLFLDNNDNSFMYTSYDNSWTYSNTFNDEIFKDYIYYPYLYPMYNIIHSCVDFNPSLDIVDTSTPSFFSNFQEKKVTHLDILPSYTSFIRKYDTSFSGIFIKKSLIYKKKLIPKIIHQISLEINVANDCINSIRDKNPTWKHIIWNKDSIIEEFGDIFNDNILIKNTNLYEQVYIIQLLILQKYGGIYIDCNYYQNIPFDDSFTRHTFFTVYKNLSKDLMLSNKVIGSVPNNPIIDKIFSIWNDYDIKFLKINKSRYTIGESFLTKFVYENPSDIFVYPNYYFNLDFCENTYLRKHNFITLKKSILNIKDYDNIYIYQYGKVASEALHETFSKINKNTFHSHHFLPQMKEKNSLIINIVRNLYDRNISAYIQNIQDETHPVWFNKNFKIKDNYSENELNLIMKHYRERNIIKVTEKLKLWYSKFNNYFDINIFSKKFSRYSIHKKENYTILILRFEDIKYWNEILYEIFNLDLKICKINDTQDKPTDIIYRLLKDNYKYSKEETEIIKNLDYIKYFYSDKELDKILSKYK